MSARWEENRKIAKRYLISARLTLVTPARFGGGDEQITDLPLLRDPETRLPLLPGASIAGAMRAYLREWELGYEKPGPQKINTRFQYLFGDVVEGPGVREIEQESDQSYLVVSDSVAENLNTEYRPGVKINPVTRIAAKDKNDKGQLYDMELLEAGTQFDLRFELSVPEDETDAKRLLEGLAIALTGFEYKEIGLGARKRRGFGECAVTPWEIQIYELKTPAGLVAWLEKSKPSTALTSANISQALGVTLPPDQRRRFKLDAKFQLANSLLIRSGSGDEKSPDMVHLQSKRNGTLRSILSGTSLAGALRARALRIANTLQPAQAAARIERIFGPADIQELKDRDQAPWASRSILRERDVQGRSDLVQSRIRIDPFSGGTFPGALFEQQPLIGGKQSEIDISIELRNPEDADIGLLLHLLKDLWTNDLALGGEASVGRGRLKGRVAELKLHSPGKEPQLWIIKPGEKNALSLQGDTDALNEYARAAKGGA